MLRPYNRSIGGIAFCSIPHAGRQRANAGDFKLRQENGERHSGEDGEMKSCTGGGAQRLRRVRARGAADAGGGSGCARRSKGSRGTKNGSDIAGVLNPGKDDKKRRAGGSVRRDELVERSFVRFDQSRDALRMLRVGESFKEAIGGAKRGKGHLRAVDQRRESFVMALAGFAEEHGLNSAAGA